MKKTYVQFSKRMTVVSVVSAVLIALGTEWITPTGCVDWNKRELNITGR